MIYIFKDYKDLAFNLTQLQYQIIGTANDVARNFEPYLAEIKRWMSEYPTTIRLWSYNLNSQLIAIVAALIVGFIIAATSKRLSSRRRREHQPLPNKNTTDQKETSSDTDWQLLREEISQLPAVKHDRKLSEMLSEAISSFKSSREVSEADSQKAIIKSSGDRQEKMEHLIAQYVKEIEFLNSEIARLSSDLQEMETVRDENSKLRRKFNQLLGEVGELRRKLALTSQAVNNDEEIRNLEYQLLYGNTEKDKLIASLQKELAAKENLLRNESSRNSTCTEDSINKWLFEDCDTEYAL